MQYHINIFRHHEITLFPPSQLDSAAEILLRHLCKYHSKQVKLIVNVLTGLIMISDLGMGLGQNFPAQGRFGPAWPSPNWLGLGLGQIQTHSLIDGFGPKFSGPRPIWAGPAQPKSVGPWAGPGPNPSLIRLQFHLF